MLVYPCSNRQYIMYEALRKGATVDELFNLTKIKKWFLEQMLELVEEENALIAAKGSVPAVDVLKQAKLDGFSDRYIAKLVDVTEEEVRKARYAAGIREGWEGVHVSGTKDSAYYYSTYNAPDKTTVSDKKKVMILGGGPNRINIKARVGGIAAYLTMAPTNCFNIGNITFCKAWEGTVTDLKKACNVGGIAGYLEKTTYSTLDDIPTNIKNSVGNGLYIVGKDIAKYIYENNITYDTRLSPKL